MFKTGKIAIIFVISLIVHAHSHDRLMKPVNRSSIWRVPEFKQFNPPKNYNDMELFCGGIHQKEVVGGNCGFCGDRYSDPRPRANELGGKFYKGIITGRYTAGGIIDIKVQLTQSHLGFMEFRLCANPEQGETQQCFNKYLLQRADGKGSKTMVNRTGWYELKYRLPTGLTCKHCSLQWNYRAGRGCGPQETFRGCSDISITSKRYDDGLLSSLVL